MFSKFIKIEKEYPVEEIEHNNEKCWEYLRAYYINKSIGFNFYSKHKQNKNTKLGNYFSLLKQSLYGFRNWFRRYDYIAFSNLSRVRSIENIDIDVNLDVIIKKLGYNKSLYIDSSDISYKSLNTKYNIVHLSLIKLFIKISSLLYSKKVKRISILEEINKNEQVDVDYINIIHHFKRSVFVYKILFKIYKPKAIFSYCYTCGMQAAIKAANDLGIPTIEFQHGIIGKKHPSYNFYKKVDNSYYPKTLLTFGEYDTKILSNNIYNPFENIVPIGRHSLELIKQQKIAKELLELKKKYNKIVSISPVDNVEDLMANFIKKIAQEYNNTLFIFSLRFYSKDYYTKFDLPENVLLYKEEFTCYDILKVSDIHMTFNSTCAIEALFFRKPTILLDIDGLARDSSLSEIKSKNIYFISKPNEFEKYLNIKYIFEKDNEIYSQNHEKLLDDFLTENLLLDKKAN